MKRLSKIKLHAIVLENREMKMIYGGSGDNNADCTELACILEAISGGEKSGALAYGKCSSGILIPGDVSCKCVFD